MSSLSQYNNKMAKKHRLYRLCLRAVSSHAFRYYLSFSIFSLLVWFAIIVVLFKFAEANNRNNVFKNVDEEAELLITLEKEQGEQALVDAISSLRYPYSLYSYYYIYADAEHNYIAGEIESWPTFKDAPKDTKANENDDRYYFDLPITLSFDPLNRPTEFFAKKYTFANGNQLMVAHSTYIFWVYTQSFRTGMKIALMIASLIAVVLAFTLAFMTQREFDSLNLSIRRIMAGDLNERISTDTAKVESKELAENLNGMLDKIYLLMEDVRRVSDNIAHDLNTPLARLRNNIQHLIQESPEGQKEQLNALLLECNDLLKTFNALLLVAKIESGGASIEKQTLDLNAILQDVIELYEPLAESKNIEIETAFSSDHRVVGDRNLLFQVIANILDNSIKYSSDSNKISITLQPGIASEGTCALDALKNSNSEHFTLDIGEQQKHDLMHYISIRIRDKGMGLPASSHKKIFQRFYREEKSRSQKPGNGLGLSMVMAVMQIHQGAIYVNSPQRGLSITLVLPTTDLKDFT